MKNKILLYDNMHARFIQQKIKQQTYYETALQYTTTSCAPILVLQSLVIPSTNKHSDNCSIYLSVTNI